VCRGAADPEPDADARPIAHPNSDSDTSVLLHVDRRFTLLPSVTGSAQGSIFVRAP